MACLYNFDKHNTHIIFKTGCSRLVRCFCLYLTLCNQCTILTTFLWVKKSKYGIKSPIWFLNLIALASIFFSTTGIAIGIFDKSQTSFFILIVASSVLYGLGIRYGLKVKSGFYLSVIPLSVIVIISALLVKLSNDASMFFFISLFVIGSVTLVIKNLIDLQKKWINELM